MKIVDYWAVYIDDSKENIYAVNMPPSKCIDYKCIDEPLLSDGIYRIITVDGLKAMITARNIERIEWKAFYKD